MALADLSAIANVTFISSSGTMTSQGKLKFDSHQVLRIFFSADLENSAAFKALHPPKYEKDLSPEKRKDFWPVQFGAFFNDFIQLFQARTREACDRYKDEFDYGDKKSDAPSFVRPWLWRIIGDEIVFVADLEHEAQVYFLVRAFWETIHAIDARLPDDLGVKGTVWTAGFPIRNNVVAIQSDLSPNVRVIVDEVVDREWSIGAARNPNLYSVSSSFDYVGVDMDLGFRLTKFVTAGQVVVSADAAYFLCESPEKLRLNLFHIGDETLRGIFGGSPIRILWVDFYDHHPTGSRRSADPEKMPLQEKYQSRQGALKRGPYRAWFKEWSDALPDEIHIEPYIDQKNMVDGHIPMTQNQPRQDREGLVVREQQDLDDGTPASTRERDAQDTGSKSGKGTNGSC